MRKEYLGRESRSEQGKGEKNQVMIRKEKQNNHVFMFSQDVCFLSNLKVELGECFEGVLEDCSLFLKCR